MRGADVNDMRVTSDALIQVIEVDRNGCLAFREQRLQFSHSHRIVLGVVECEVADLRKSKSLARER